MKNLSKLILFVCFGVLFAACNNDNLTDSVDINGGGSDFESNGPKVTKTFSFSIPDMTSAGLDISRAELEEDADEAVSFGLQPATRTTVAATDAEKYIKDLYIIQYDASGNILGNGQLVPASEMTVDASTGNVSVDITIDEAANSKLYVFANCQPVHANTNTTEAKLKADSISVSTAITSAELASKTKGLPMMGVATLASSASTINVSMSFLVAKISTKISTNLPSGASFTPTQVTIVDVPKFIYITSDAITSTLGGYHSSYAAITSGLTGTLDFYVPENKCGKVDGLTAKTKSWWDAPEHAMRLRIIGDYKKSSTASAVSIYYELYPGADSSTDFNVARNTVYTINPTIKGTNVSSDLRVWANTLINLNTKATGSASSDTSANCYIAHNSGTAYHFNATIKGNGINTLGAAASTHEPTSVEVLWEAPATGNIIRKVKLYGGHVYFLTSGSVGGDVHPGNALIAVKGAGKILWSWHIWSTGAISTESYKIRATGTGIPATVKMMSRNLGATNNEPDDPRAFGLLYQWGRKDPFVGAAATSGTDYAASSKDQDWPVEEAKNTGANANASISYAIEHPTTFITQVNTTTFDWLNAPTVADQLNDLWGNASTVTGTVSVTNLNKEKGRKTLYDPCPIGYKVPPQYTWTNFTKDGNNSSTTSNFNVADKTSFATDHGWTFYTSADDSGDITFYPATGCRGVSTGALYNVGTNGYALSSSPLASGSPHMGYLRFNAGNVYPLESWYRSAGFPVRCVQEF